MKKQLTTTLLGLALAATAHAENIFEDLVVLTSVSFESEYVFRGIQLADESIQPSVELRSGDLYGGFWASVPLEDEYSEEINLYAGYGFDLSEKVHLDLGYMYYWYVNDNDAIDPTNLGGQGFGYDFRNEVYAGLYGDYLGRPQAYLYYDWELDQIVIEFSAGHSYSLENLSEALSNASLELGGYAGLVDTDDVNSEQNTGSPENGYTYWGFTADLAYRFKDGLAATIGMRYAGNNDEPTPTVGQVSGIPVDKDSNFWWGASIAAGF